jgi:hypothetical protein
VHRRGLMGANMKNAARVFVFVTGVLALWLALAPSAWSVPSYTRRYEVECSRCHTIWGSLTAAGVQFRLSGYRAIAGVDLKPGAEDIELSRGLLTIPSQLPLSFITGVGYDDRTEKRTAFDGTHNTRRGSSLAVEDASIFLTAPLGNHLSAFVEFPMYETKAWEFTPTGPAEANNKTGGRQIQFVAESPTFEVAKFWWNNLFGEGIGRDSVNALFGITHLPLAYPSGKVRLSVNQYLIYERRALDLISPQSPAGMLGGADEHLFRLGEPQALVEINGMVVPGKDVTEISKRETFWFEYHLGVDNGSNSHPDNNVSKDLYGRFVMRWYNQSLGLFAYYSPDTYDDNMRTTASIAVGGADGLGGIMSGQHRANRRTTIGPDATLSLAPFDIPVSLENNVLFSRESDPTGFGTAFSWFGGFHQLNWQINKETMTYLRYDWIHGDTFNDIPSGGVTHVKPKEMDIVFGVQHLIRQNIKLVGEYRHHEFEDTAATPHKATLVDDGFTTRIMIGF